jgi:hypothetical protein
LYTYVIIGSSPSNIRYEKEASISKGKQTTIPYSTEPMHRSGWQIFDMLKAIEIVFGKGPGSQPIPSGNGMAVIWKKKSIFWELPY